MFPQNHVDNNRKCWAFFRNLWEKNKKSRRLLSAISEISFKHTDYIQLMRRKYQKKSKVMKMEAPMVSGKPQTQCSMPLRRFIPKMLAMSVGNMRMMLTEVIVFIVWLMLLLMIAA